MVSKSYPIKTQMWTFGGLNQDMKAMGELLKYLLVLNNVLKMLDNLQKTGYTKKLSNYFPVLIEDAKSSVSGLYRGQKRLHGLCRVRFTLLMFSYSQTKKLLASRYFNGQCSQKIHFLVPLVLTFIAWTD